MTVSLKKVLIASLTLIASTAFAAPKELTTHNQTTLESNAYIAGTIASQHPVKAGTSRRVMWTQVRMACYGHVVNGKCPALVKMGTNTPTPVDIGYLELDLNTGMITPSQISGNGYTLTVNGPAECTLTKD